MDKSFSLGPRPSPPEDARAYREWEQKHILWLKANTRTYICDPCWLYLSIPFRLAAANWEGWKRSSTEGYHPYTDYPFLTSLVSRIDLALKNNPELPVELGSIACPYCSTTLAIKEEFSPVCPQCGVADMKFTGGGIASLRYGVVWPPIA